MSTIRLPPPTSFTTTTLPPTSFLAIGAQPSCLRPSSFRVVACRTSFLTLRVGAPTSSFGAAANGTRGARSLIFETSMVTRSSSPIFEVTSPKKLLPAPIQAAMVQGKLLDWIIVLGVITPILVTLRIKQLCLQNTFPPCPDFPTHEDHLTEIVETRPLPAHVEKIISLKEVKDTDKPEALS